MRELKGRPPIYIVDVDRETGAMVFSVNPLFECKHEPEAPPMCTVRPRARFAFYDDLLKDTDAQKEEK